MVREKAPSSFIARGWAIGMFYGCTIPFGFQLILSVPTAVFMRGSKVGMGGSLSYDAICEAMKSVVREQSWSSLLQLGGELTGAFFVGGFAIAAVLVPLTYFGVKRYVEFHRARREAAKTDGDE